MPCGIVAGRRGGGSGGAVGRWGGGAVWPYGRGEVGLRLLAVGCWLLDVGCWALNRRSMLGVRISISGVSFHPVLRLHLAHGR
ncbi:MAG: hypothetical protein FJ221_10565 [Lentisphaerae bacterium]|nr:hypothetical protein [Lentisphaerota bacterium]